MDDLVQEVTKKEETANQAKILYLKKVDDKIAIKQGVNFKGIQLDLNVVAEGNNRKKNRITAYTEDKENILFVKAILKEQGFCVGFCGCNITMFNINGTCNQKSACFYISIFYCYIRWGC